MVVVVMGGGSGENRGAANDMDDLDSEGPYMTGGGSYTTTVPRLSVPTQGQE